MSHPPNSNGNRHTSITNVKQRSSQKLYTTVPKVSSKGLDHKKNMDLKNDKDKALEFNHHECHPLDKKGSVLLQNGVVNCGLITNGYSSKDNDGSGSEGGYTTPKKRKARCNNTKNSDNVIREKDKEMQPGNTTQDHGAFNLETVEKGVTSRLDGFKAANKVEAQSSARRTAASEASMGESQRKNSDGKSVGTFGKKTEDRHKAKLSSPSKEDSWTLFKPPPVFPVDNSSAKIVPKISYASKVKENLNKVAQVGTFFAPATNQKALGDIFQNQWGLSFINEPNLGAEGGSGQVPTEDKTAVVTLQSECQAGTAKAAQPCFDVSPSFLEPGTLAQDPEKRTCAPYPKRVVVYDEAKDGPDQ
uniref:Nuclear FMR1 interacting protein 2 n=1 Tax=Labrus bergylta TaxID=56723 RepID=A0A3Q3LJR5_9LABR